MKKFTPKVGFSISALVPVLLLSTQIPLAQAQEAEPKIYSCKQCIKYTGWSGYLDFGLGYVSEDSLRFADYRGLDEKGYYAALDGDIHFRNLQGRYFDLYAQELGLDSRRLEMRGGNQGRYELRFGWQEIPKYRGYGTATPFIGVGSDTLTLPSNWVYASSTGAMTELESSLAAAALKTQRKVLDAGGTVQFARNWSYRIDYQRQEKKGTRAISGGLFNATVMPAPVDFKTDIFDTALSWAGKRAQFQIGFMSSNFENKNTSISWRNPFSSRSSNYILQAALEPDNEFYQFNVSGAVVITPRVRLSAQASAGHATQDDPFIPHYSTNPGFSDLVLPRASLDGKLDTTTYNVTGKLSARLSNRLSFTARGKFDERENKTPIDLYTPVTIDLLQGRDRFNRPYSYEREQYSADLRYRVGHSISFSGGAGQNNLDRTLQSVEHSEETTFWGGIKASPTLNTQVRFKLESADRDISDYLTVFENPLMRKFNQADRDRDRALVEIDFMPTDAFGINLSYFQAMSDYTESELGVQESEEQSYTINLNYAVGNTVNMYAFLTRDNIDAILLNSTSVSADPWEAITKDEITTVGVGFSKRINKKSSIGFDYVFSDSTGDIWVQTSNEEEPFEPLHTELINARVYFDSEVNEHWGYKISAELEKYHSQDWAIDGLGVDGIGSVLTMGEQSPEYKVWYVRVQASYRF